MPRPSTGDYPANWIEISKQVKDDAGWKCVRCGHRHDREFVMLHLDQLLDFGRPFQLFASLEIAG